MKLIFVILFSFSGGSMAQANPHQCKGFFPKNNLWIPDTHANKGISHKVFNGVIDRIEKIYKGEVAALGFKLQFNRLWSDGTVNSDTDVEGQSWVINSYGGLARYPGMTADGYAAVACHELGHHLGGAPRFTDDDWASVEGESDYFATLKCLRRYFAGKNDQAVAPESNSLAQEKCQRSFANSQDQKNCVRGAQAGLTIAEVLRSLESAPAIAFNTPDPNVVTETYADHPAAQCRLDTYFNGSLCTAPVSEPMSGNDYHPGSCTDAQAATGGWRPLCWFKP